MILSPINEELQADSWITGPLSYSDIQGEEVYSGTGNINAAPLFADAENGDYHLEMASPCINVAKSSGSEIPSNDIDGDSRDQGTAYDMGADEFIIPDADLADVIGDLRILSGLASSQFLDVNGDDKIGLDDVVYILRIISYFG